MTLTPTEIPTDIPAEFEHVLKDTKIFDSSCSPVARVFYMEKDGGYFLKSAPKGALERQALMMRYFHGKGLSSEVLGYVSAEKDWLLTAKIPGDDCISAKYLEQPERLCDSIAERLVLLHGEDFADCPVQDFNRRHLAKAAYNKRHDLYDKSEFPDSFGYATPEEAWAVVEAQGHLLQSEALLHGDYCLPNIILDDWRFSGFIDIEGGVGDRHIDIFWGIWSLFFNFHSHQYRQRFIDAYGRDRVDEEMLRVVAAVEVFG